MKVRNGFVSNSSSSSFIVIFDKKPESVEETQKALFGSDDPEAPWEECDPWYMQGDNPVLQRRVANRVFEDVKDQRGMNSEEIAEEYNNSWFYFYHDPEPGSWDERKGFEGKDMPYFCPDPKIFDKLVELKHAKWGTPLYKTREKWEKASSMKSAEALMKDNEDKFIASFSYSDSEGDSLFEHAGIFNNLDFIKFSHH